MVYVQSVTSAQMGGDRWQRTGRYTMVVKFENGLITTFKFHFTGRLKMKWFTSLPNKFNKEATWLKINKWAINLFWSSSDLYPDHQSHELLMTIIDGVSS